MASDGRERRARELRVIVDAKALELHTYVKCRSQKVFPKKDRGGLPSRMMDEATEAVSDMMDANDYDLRDAGERKLRLSMQRAALRSLRRLSHHIEMARELKCISEDEFAYWSRMAVSVRNQCAAWHKSDKRRCADLD